MFLHSTTVATFGPQLPKPVATPRGAPGKPKDDQERPPMPTRNPGTTRSTGLHEDLEGGRGMFVGLRSKSVVLGVVPGAASILLKLLSTEWWVPCPDV